MSRPELLLENQVCFLIHKLDRAVLARYRPLLEGLGLTYPQYLCMLALWERDGRTVGELCSALDLDTGTVSPLLKRLEAAGYLRRARDAGDERVVTVALTEAGRALEERALSVPATLASCLFRDLEDYAGLKSTLEATLARLDVAPTEA